MGESGFFEMEQGFQDLESGSASLSEGKLTRNNTNTSDEPLVVSLFIHIFSITISFFLKALFY